MTDTPNIPPAASRLQAIIAPLLSAYKSAEEAAEGTPDGIVLVEGLPVARVVQRLQQLAQDMIEGSEDAPAVFRDQTPPSLHAIADECAAEFGIDREQMRRCAERRGIRRIMNAKKAYVYLARKLHCEKKSFSQIGLVLRPWHYSSVMHAHKTAMSAMESDREFHHAVRMIERRLMGG